MLKPASVMCAFPEINGVSACSSDDLLKTTLRDRWGFTGYVITDRRALHDAAPSIKAGADWELAHITPLFYSLDPQPGQAPWESGRRRSQGGACRGKHHRGKPDLDQMLRRRYVQMFEVGQFDADCETFYGSSVDFVGHDVVAREIAEHGDRLAQEPEQLLAAEPREHQVCRSSWSAVVRGPGKVTARAPVRADNADVRCSLHSHSPSRDCGTRWMAMGSTATVTYNSAAGTKSDRQAAIELAKKSDVVIVMLGDNPHELCDRETLGFPMIPPADPEFCAWDELKPGRYKLPNPPAGNDGTRAGKPHERADCSARCGTEDGGCTQDGGNGSDAVARPIYLRL